MADPQSNGVDNALSESEHAIYDRQLRMWGMEAQKRMRNSHILMIGMNGLAAEICKNLVLTGIGALTIYDPSPITLNDLSANFLLTHGKLGDNCAEIAAANIRELNPNVRIHVEAAGVLQETSAKYFEQYDIVCCTRYEFKDWIRINTLCRDAKTSTKSVSFFAASCKGLYGYFFEDLNIHNYLIASNSKEESGSDKEVMQSSTAQYISLQDTLNANWSQTLKSFGKRIGAATAPLWLALVILSKWNETHPLPLLSTEESQYKELLSYRDQLCAQHSISSTTVPNNLILELAHTWHAEVSSVCAILGGMCAAEILKVLTGKDTPLQNVCLYSVHTGAGVVGNIVKA